MIKPYTAMLLRMGPQADGPDAQQLIWEHGRRNFALREAGKMPVVCPTTDDGKWAGVAIFDVPVDEARRIMDEDPGIKAGVFTYELLPVLGFPGSALP